MDNGDQKRGMNLVQRFLDLMCLTPMGGLGLVILALLPLVPPFNQEYLIRWLVAGGIMGASAIAFDFTGGYIAIVNFGFMAFFGLGAYTSALVSLHFGLSPWLGMFIGVIPAGLMGFLTGIMTLRLRGIFAIALTWFFGLALMGLAIKMVWLTRGSLGLRSPRLLDANSNLPYFYIVLAMLLVTYIIMKWVVRSPIGLAFRAIGQNMEAAKTSGIHPFRYRILNFTLSCAFTGWLGGFYAHYYGLLTPDLMSTSKTVEVLVVAYIGGRTSLWGGAFIAFPFVYFLEIIRSTFSNLPGVHLVIYGVFLILVMIYYPGGAAQLYQNLIGRTKNRVVRLLVGLPRMTYPS